MDIIPPSSFHGYPQFLEKIKSRIKTTQIKAALSANRELILLYWDIGKSIVERQLKEGWGKAVVERLATDIQRDFPGIEGFSRSNIGRMRSFYLAWHPISAQAARKLEPEGLPKAASEIPWFHNVILFQKIKSPSKRLWYAKMAIQNGWSRAVLTHQIESDLYGRQGKAVTNFNRTLPPPQSDLAEQAIKDPYTFDFLTLSSTAHERELEDGLLNHIQRFLLELGVGFAFLGRQVHLEVAGDDFYIDLLFYHVRLRCYLVIELKNGPFKPEYAGKMNFYLSAVDDRLRHREDRPSIGMILCKSSKKLIAEYALRDARKPIGIAAFRLTKALPKKLQGRLPAVSDLESALKSSGRRSRRSRHPRPWAGPRLGPSRARDRAP